MRFAPLGLVILQMKFFFDGMLHSRLFAMRTLLQVHFWVEGEFVFLIGFKTESEPTEAAPSVDVGA